MYNVTQAEEMREQEREAAAAAAREKSVREQDRSHSARYDETEGSTIMF